MDASGDFPALCTVLKIPDQAEERKLARQAFANAAGDKELSDDQINGIIHNNDSDAIYDVKFYPYDEEPMFAVVSTRDVYVFRPNADHKQPVEMLATFRDSQPDASLNSLVWSQDNITADPLICFAGSGSGEIRIVNVCGNAFQRMLTGHGGAINDLAVSPQSPTILASASADHTIRLWNLDHDFLKRSCAAILAGPEAHTQPVLAIAFHSGGRYLLSGGTDTMINLWGLPAVPDANAGTDRTTRIYFPLFSSTEVHPDYVDCVRFHGDMIFSRAAASSKDNYKTSVENVILLWKIDGFNSYTDPKSHTPQMGEPGVWTRSAFGGKFQRLMTFSMPNTTPFYMRFGLFDRPGYRPMLAMGDAQSKFLFWDLATIEEDLALLDDGMQAPGAGTAANGAAATPLEGSTDMATPVSDSESTPRPGRANVQARGRGRRKRGTAYRARGRGGGYGSGASGSGSNSKRSYGGPADLSNAFWPVPPHHEITAPKYNFTVRQTAWSVCGRWMVAGGGYGLVCIFRRWAQYDDGDVDDDDDNDHDP